MRITPAGVGVTLLSLTVAGLIGSVHGDGLADFQRPVKLGQSVPISGDQRIRPLELTWGQYAVEPGVNYSMLSPGRLIAVRFALTTPGREEARSMRCFLRYRDGTVAESVSDDRVSFPSPGFKQEGTVLLETGRAKLPGATVVCTTSDVITVRETEMTLDLGLDDAAATKVWEESEGRRVSWREATLEVLP